MMNYDKPTRDFPMDSFSLIKVSVKGLNRRLQDNDNNFFYFLYSTDDRRPLQLLLDIEELRPELSYSPLPFIDAHGFLFCLSNILHIQCLYILVNNGGHSVKVVIGKH